MTPNVAKQTRRSALIAGAVIACLIAVSAAQVRRPLAEDEATYFTIARDIARLHVPAWTWDGERYQLFGNSPPVVLYAGSLFQRSSTESNIVMTRLFVLATCAAFPIWTMWLFLRKRYGLQAATIAIGIPFITWTFLDDAFRFRLDVPLGAASAAALVLYYKAISAQSRRHVYLVAAGLMMFLSCWIKFQAVCVLGAAVAYALWLEFNGPRDERWRVRAATGVMVFATVAALTSWFIFAAVATRHLRILGVGILSTPEQTLDGILSFNFGRILEPIGSTALLQLLVTRALQPTIAKTGFLIVLVAMAGAVAGSVDGLTLLASGYCAITLLFNLVVFNLPGAGGYYLIPMVPVVCIPLAWAISVLRASPISGGLMRVAGILVILHLSLNVPKVNQMIQTTDLSRQVADAIANADRDGVVAVSDKMWGIGYFADRTVAQLGNMPAESERRLFEATPPRLAAVVVTQSYAQRIGLEKLASQLDTGFVRVKTIPLPGNEIWVYLPRGS